MSPGGPCAREVRVALAHSGANLEPAFHLSESRAGCPLPVRNREERAAGGDLRLNQREGGVEATGVVSGVRGLQ